MVIFEKKKFASPECRKKKFASRVIFCPPPINIKWLLPNTVQYLLKFFMEQFLVHQYRNTCIYATTCTYFKVNCTEK